MMRLRGILLLTLGACLILALMGCSGEESHSTMAIDESHQQEEPSVGSAAVRVQATNGANSAVVKVFQAGNELTRLRTVVSRQDSGDTTRQTIAGIPSGETRFACTLHSSTDGTGDVLAEGEDMVRIVAGETVTVQPEFAPGGRPQISSVIVDPMTLPAHGGDVQVTAAVKDGDGIAEVIARMVNPENYATDHTMRLMPGTSPKDGTYRTTINIDPNEIREDQNDATRTLTYSIRVKATDNRNHTTWSVICDVTVL